MAPGTHEVRMPSCPVAERAIAKPAVCVLGPARQARVDRRARLRRNPLRECYDLLAALVFLPPRHHLEKVRARIAHLAAEHGLPELAHPGSPRPAGEGVRVLEGVEVDLYALWYVFHLQRPDLEIHFGLLG